MECVCFRPMDRMAACYGYLLTNPAGAPEGDQESAGEPEVTPGGKSWHERKQSCL